MDRMAVNCGVWSASSFTTSPVGQAPIIHLGPLLTSHTDFPFDSEDEKQSVISFSSNNKAQRKAVFDMPRLLERLAPYKCGFLKQLAPPPPPRQRIFTMQELGRHIYPEVGMYCAIDGDVYDIGRKYLYYCCYALTSITRIVDMANRLPSLSPRRRKAPRDVCRPRRHQRVLRFSP
jgi:hypothetical protein